MIATINKKKKNKIFSFDSSKSDLKIFQMKFPIGYEWITASYSTCENNKKKCRIKFFIWKLVFEKIRKKFYGLYVQSNSTFFSFKYFYMI